MTQHKGRALLGVDLDERPTFSEKWTSATRAAQCLSRGTVPNYRDRQCWGIEGHKGPHYLGKPESPVMYWVEGAVLRD